MPKMRASVYDTRFFLEFFYRQPSLQFDKLERDLSAVGRRVVSVITIHEVYRISLLREGRAVAKLRSGIMRRDFDVVDVDYDIAVKSAELKHKYDIPMADSIIAVTALINKCPVVSDDPHFAKVKEVRTRWFSLP